jgi:hypothetical protein
MSQTDTCLSIDDSLSVTYTQYGEYSNCDISWPGKLPDDPIIDNTDDQKEALVSSRRRWLAILES